MLGRLHAAFIEGSHITMLMQLLEGFDDCGTEEIKWIW